MKEKITTPTKYSARIYSIQSLFDKILQQSIYKDSLPALNCADYDYYVSCVKKYYAEDKIYYKGCLIRKIGVD